MAKPLNFNNIKKKYLTVTLADAKQTTIMIGTPTKAVMDEILVLKDTIDQVNEDEVNSDVTDDLYSACAKIMSRNKTGTKIEADFIADLFDFEDILIFFNAYMDFISEISNEKN